MNSRPALHRLAGDKIVGTRSLDYSQFLYATLDFLTLIKVNLLFELNLSRTFEQRIKFYRL